MQRESYEFFKIAFNSLVVALFFVTRVDVLRGPSKKSIYIFYVSRT